MADLSKATLRPWRMGEAYSSTIVADTLTGYSNCVASYVGDDDAALIVKCVNLHDELVAALNYVADMTYCGADAEWHFKKGYDPQCVLDAIAKLEAE